MALWLLDADLGDAVASLPWLADGVVFEQSFVLRHLAHLANADLNTARMTASLSWFIDEPTVWESQAVRSLSELAHIDPQLPGPIVDLPWFRDGIEHWEDSALKGVTRVSSADLDLAKRILSSSWFADDISRAESSALNTLGNLALRYPELLSLWGEYAISESGDVAGLVLDGISAIYRAMDEKDGFWDRLNEQPWFIDGLSKIELAFVGVLRHLGEEGMSAALREIYLLFGETGDAKTVTEEELYQAFLRNTPPDLREEFLALSR